METTQEPAACALFCLPCSGRRLHGGQEYRSLLPTEATGVWEGIPAARPEPKDPSPQKWAALLRRLDCHGAVGGGRKRRMPLLQYDPVSYALNFDNGAGSPAAIAAARPLIGFSPPKDSSI